MHLNQLLVLSAVVRIGEKLQIAAELSRPVYLKVVWVIGILMMSGQLAGAWLGSHCLFKIDPGYLRMIVVAMCLGMLIKYGFTTGWIGSGAAAP